MRLWVGVKPSCGKRSPMIEARGPMHSRDFLRGLLILGLAIPVGLAQKKSPVNGTWNLSVGGQSYRIEFVEEDGDVRGTVTLPDGKAIEVEYGLIFGKELEFTTVENGVEFEWTAEVSRNSIKGERVNLDDETAARFTARRAR